MTASRVALQIAIAIAIAISIDRWRLCFFFGAMVTLLSRYLSARKMSRPDDDAMR